MKEFDVEEELSKILQEEVNNEIANAIKDGDVHINKSGTTIFGKLTEDEKEFWGLNNL